MTDNYVSPYGFGPVIDMMLDCVAERHGMTVDELAERIHKNAPTYDPYASRDSAPSQGIYDWLDTDAWDDVIGPAIDRIDDHIFLPGRPADGS